MFNIKREGSQVEINVAPGLLRYGFPFRFSAGSDWSAELLMEKIRQAHSTAVRAARLEAYEQGWTDARAKRKKRESFSGCLA